MNKGVFTFWSIFIAAAITRLVFSMYQEGPSMDQCLRQEVKGIGTIAAEPERKESGQVFIVLAKEVTLATSSAYDTVTDKSHLCGNDIQIRMKTKLYPRFVYGDNVSFTGKISQPFNFKSQSGRSFDYKGYLAKDDVFFEMKSAVVEPVIAGSIIVENIQDDNTVQRIIGKISSILFSIKRRFVSNLERTLGEPHAALAAGLVVGEKSALGKDLLNDFRIVGLIHIVVLSGFNITVVGDAMRRILSFLPRVWGISVGGIGIALFGVMVGGGATVVRSCFMAGIALSADLLRRDCNVTRALIFAALVMLIQNPMILLHDPSFQLSFLATLGLVLLASPIEKKLVFLPEKFGIRGIVASTIATQIFVSPYILYMMGQISIIGMVVNILVLPVIPATMLVVFLTGALGFIYLPAAQFFAWISHLLLSYELHMVNWFARLPFASVTLPIFSGWWVVGFYVWFGVVFWTVFYKGNIAREKTSDYDILISTVNELSKTKQQTFIQRPDGLLYVSSINKITEKIISTKNPKVYISRRAIKHIIERRGIDASFVFSRISSVLENPTKIVDNFAKLENSFLLVKFDTRTVGVVLEITKTPDMCQVVSAFLINPKTYKKLIDISGRTELPPFELSP